MESQKVRSVDNYFNTTGLTQRISPYSKPTLKNKIHNETAGASIPHKLKYSNEKTEGHQLDIVIVALAGLTE